MLLAHAGLTLPGNRSCAIDLADDASQKPSSVARLVCVSDNLLESIGHFDNAYFLIIRYYEKRLKGDCTVESREFRFGDDGLHQSLGLFSGGTMVSGSFSLCLAVKTPNAAVAQIEFG